VISQQQIDDMKRRMSDIQFDLTARQALQIGRKLASDVKLLLNQLERLRQENNNDTR
jgi:hypothetical protein